MHAECLATSGNTTAAWHFGSTAKGRYRPGADIDIGVLFARKPSLDELADLRAALQNALGPQIRPD